MLYPLTFHPIFKERVWGGRSLQTLYQKPLPPGRIIGESWEISDRPGDASVIVNGPLAGKDLRWLMEHHAEALLGSARSQDGRFPLLAKILDAQDKLSLQVHPPAALAATLGGEPKTEMWYFAHTTPTAEIYAGLKHDVSRAEFERNIKTGEVGQCFHRLAARPGDALLLPSGRVHAIGAGNVIFEIQQNSDTTYRVFDWNRAGLDGKPRELHVAEALASMDFNDFEPQFADARPVSGTNHTTRSLVHDPLFDVNEITLRATDHPLPCLPRPQIIAIVQGGLTVQAGENSIRLRAGQFCLVPAVLRTAILSATAPVTFLHVVPA